MDPNRHEWSKADERLGSGQINVSVNEGSERVRASFIRVDSGPFVVGLNRCGFPHFARPTAFMMSPIFSSASAMYVPNSFGPAQRSPKPR